MKKLGIFIPLHIATLQDIYMANMQSRFLCCCKKYLSATTVMTIDKDDSGRFEGCFRNTGTDYLIDLTDTQATGIVGPTLHALKKASEQNCGVFMRLTQDTQVIDFNKFVVFVQQMLQKESEFLCGRKAICGDIGPDLGKLGVSDNNQSYDYVQGNLVMASMELWRKRYPAVAQAVTHYRDDSLFSYLVEHLDGIKPTFIEPDFWREIRTKDVYYLERLYNNRTDFAERT